MVTVTLIDDHPSVSGAIGAWLCSTGRFTIAGTAKNLTEARTLFTNPETLPDIIILDISLGKEDGLSLIPELKKIYKKRKTKIAIMVCSVHENTFNVKRAMKLGAQGYVPKSAELSEILAAIDTIRAGNTYISPRTEKQQEAVPALSDRENEVAALVKQSLTNTQIAERTGVGVRTVEKHLEHIYNKLNITSREELLML